MTGSQRRPVVLGPGEGREYPMGRLSAVFKADGEETAGGYSISEWWLDPYTRGPDAHQHPEDDVFYVLEGTMSSHARRPRRAELRRLVSDAGRRRGSVVASSSSARAAGDSRRPRRWYNET